MVVIGRNWSNNNNFAYFFCFGRIPTKYSNTLSCSWIFLVVDVVVVVDDCCSLCFNSDFIDS